jgi:UDP-N-acetylmuramate: L-alanyl-gamma-D-glutamyl-meso-diaminopimelate ligase
VKWDVASLAKEIGPHARVHTNIETLVGDLASEAKPSDHILIMSNGGFGGIHGKLLAKLKG